MSEKSRFIYKRLKEDVMNESKVKHEEFLSDGPKGLRFVFMKLDKKKNMYKDSTVNLVMMEKQFL